VRDLGFVQNLAFAHSTKAAGSTVDLVLCVRRPHPLRQDACAVTGLWAERGVWACRWNMAHRLNTSVFIRPKVWSKVKVRAAPSRKRRVLVKVVRACLLRPCELSTQCVARCLHEADTNEAPPPLSAAKLEESRGLTEHLVERPAGRQYN
jgi:hypothetical protein